MTHAELPLLLKVPITDHVAIGGATYSGVSTTSLPLFMSHSLWCVYQACLVVEVIEVSLSRYYVS